MLQKKSKSLIVKIWLINRIIGFYYAPAIARENIDLNVAFESENTKIKITETTQLLPNYVAESFPAETSPNIIEKIPNSISPDRLEKTSPNPENTTPEPQNPAEEKPATTESPESELSLQERIIESLSISAIKYSWIFNPTDKFTFKHQMFKPNSDRNYQDIDIRFAEDNAIINKMTHGHFPKKEQFYWILPNNIVIFETKGWQGGMVYQGRSEKSKINVKIKTKQAFGGYQAVWEMPQNFENLVKENAGKKLRILSVAGELNNPPGIKAGRVILNSKYDKNSDKNSNLLPNLGYASSRNIKGGGALFENLEISNIPLILQGFPTVDLKPILDNGKVQLKVGEVIPKPVLNAAGIFWSNSQTGEEAKFTAPITSLPGIKILQADKFDNQDLLNKLVNPSIKDKKIDRDLAYLNSLFWVSFGERKPEITLSDPIVLDNLHWYRLYVSRPHNRSLIQYHPEEVSAIYTNIFANPGASATMNFKKDLIDDMQTVHQTLGMLLGGIFEGVSTKRIDDRLIEAKEKFANRETFARVETRSTPLQRKRINQRLDRNLSYSHLNSGLKQISGNVTFPSKIKEHKSRILQIRTGLHERGIDFAEQTPGEVIRGETFFSLLRLSNKDFGPLTFIGNPIAIDLDSKLEAKVKKAQINPKVKIEKSKKVAKKEFSKKTASLKPQSQPIERSSAVKTTIVTENGQQFVREINSADNTVIPIGVKTYDLAFDRIELTRIDRQTIHLNRYIGYLNLPAVEGVFSGSQGNFNYSINGGMWLNLASNSAPSVNFNNFGIKEPSIGIYANGLFSYQFSRVELDRDKKFKAIHTHSPFLKLNWNSASNSYNPFVAVANYSYFRQSKNLKFSIAPGIAFVEKNSNGEFTGIFETNLSFKNDIEFGSNAEIGKEIFFSLEGLKRVRSNLAIGAYLQNYSFNKLNIGFNSRISNLNYGVLFRHNFLDNNIHFTGKIGTGEKGFDARFEGGYRF